MRNNSSEFRACSFIESNLKDLGWNLKNPSKYTDGQVYTQNECLQNYEIKKCLTLDRPEYVVKIYDTMFWVIEAKNEISKIDIAVKEVKGYGNKINESTNISAPFVTAVAGNADDGFIISSFYMHNSKYVPITLNNTNITSLLSHKFIERVLNEGPNLSDVLIDDKYFLKKAEEINEILHIGAINKNDRAKAMAALLLALTENIPIDLNLPPTLLINQINDRARRALKQHGKEEFSSYVELQLPPTEDNHDKYKTALVRTIQELNNINIKSAMNSGTDVLGQFYEVFLKYGNGAKEIGIVLTPRHITRFAAEILSVNKDDYILDPCCGTGGFLVSSLDLIKRDYSFNPKEIDDFKKLHVFGIEQDAAVAALAIVNMIFRGDGKNNIIDGDCKKRNVRLKKVNSDKTGEYTIQPIETKDNVITKVLMNPPFSLKSGQEKEFIFVEHALKQLVQGGILFSVLPYSAMVKPSAYLTWRKSRLLKENTLLCVMTFPEDLFYPIGVHTVGIIVKKGIPHPKDHKVLWLRLVNDGYKKSKGKRLSMNTSSNDLDKSKSLIKLFLTDNKTQIDSIIRYQISKEIDFSDKFLELVPENYLEDSKPTIDELYIYADDILRDSAAFIIRNKMEDKCSSS